MINIDLDFIAKVLGVITAFVGIMAGLFKWLNSKLSKSMGAVTGEKMDEKFKEHNEIISTKFSEIEQKITNLNQRFEDFVEREDETNKLLKRSLLASARDRIHQAHSVFMQQEFIGAHSRYVLDKLYESYKELGGNSFIDQQMEDIRKLKVLDAETIIQDQEEVQDGFNS